MNARQAYMSNMVTTASGPSLLLLLVDRLRLDVERAMDAQERADHGAARVFLLHAQDIVTELSGSLDVDACPGGANLLAIYDWLFTELVQANVKRDVGVTRGCLSIATQVADIWHEAAAHAVVA
jgi:flagellar protein FliS